MKIIRYRKMPCPHCGSMRHTTKRTRRLGTIVTRTHLCRSCGRVFGSHDDGSPPHKLATE